MVVIRQIERATEVALRLAEQAAVHGMYVRNALLREELRGFVFGTTAPDQGVCWFGPRGNLVVVVPEGERQAPEIDAAAVAERIQRTRLPWRIAMGPTAIIDALRSRCTGTPLVHRNQIYYLGEPGTVRQELVRTDLRPAAPEDRDRIVLATLQLNHVDLAIEPSRVDRRWLYNTVDERIADGTTRVLGPAGAIQSKLDFGSVGAAGVVIEGVFTFAESRGAGLASSLVASCIAQLGLPVGLHVGEQNASARRAYERAGMREVDRCRLLLLG